MDQLPAPQHEHAGLPSPVDDFKRYLDVLREGWYFVAVALLIGMTLAGLRLARIPTVYTATASVLVLQQRGRPVELFRNNVNNALEVLASMDGYSNYLSTHTRIIRSPLVIEQALASLGDASLSVRDVTGGLTVKIPRDADKILELEYRCGSREQAARILKAVIASYRKFLRADYQKNSDDLVARIEDISVKMSRDLADLEREYLEFRRVSPISADDEHGRTLAARRLDQWDQLANEAMIREFALRSELELSQQGGAGAGGAATVPGTIGRAGPVSRLFADHAGPEQDELGRLYKQLGDELGDVEAQRLAAARVLESVRAAQAASRPAVDERAVAHAFAGEPEAVALRAVISKLQSRFDEARRLARSPADPAAAGLAKALRARKEELAELWARRRPVLLEQHRSRRDDDGVIGRAEADVVALEAKAASLRERREQIRREHLGRLRDEHERLVEAVGPDHERARRLGEQVARAEQSPADGRELPGAGPATLVSLDRRLEALGRVRERIQARFEDDLKVAKQVEVDRVKESNLRNNLERQRALFNSVVDQLKQAKLMGDNGSVVVQTLDPPTVSRAPLPWRSTVVGGVVFGLVVGGMGAFAARLWSSHFHSTGELREVLRYPVLADIPQFAPARRLDDVPVGRISLMAPRSGAAEAYKLIRTRLSYLGRERRIQVILITSPIAGDGKSTTAANLATSLAQSGNRVLLVDGDLRRPSLHATFGFSRDGGLADILQGRRTLSDVVLRTELANLHVLTAGSEVDNPSELLATQRFLEALDEARRGYDFVIVDSSPLLAVTDPAIIAAAADGLILVARASTMRRDHARRAVELLQSVKIIVLGTVLNGVVAGRETAYSYGYSASLPNHRPARNLRVSWGSSKRPTGT